MKEAPEPDAPSPSQLDSTAQPEQPAAAFSLTSANPFGLKVREQVFVDRYLVTFNASAAYIQAGYKRSSGRHNAARLLRKPRIAAAIQAKISTIMDGDEALTRLSMNARFDPRKLFPADKRIAELPDDVALCIKAVTPTKHGLKIEWNDPQKAAELLAKAGGRLKEHVEHTLEDILSAANRVESGEDA
jgi:hypothetical protein